MEMVEVRVIRPIYVPFVCVFSDCGSTAKIELLFKKIQIFLDAKRGYVSLQMIFS